MYIYIYTTINIYIYIQLYIYIYTTIHTPLHPHLGCLNPHIHRIGFANFMYWLAKSSLLLVKPSLIATDIPELTRLDPPIPIVSHDFHSSIGLCGYPLVNIQKNWWENHHFQWVKPLWMAMFNSYVSHYQRVSPMFRPTLIFHLDVLASLKRFNIDLINNDAHFIGLDQQRGLNSICPTNVCCLFDFNSKNQDLCVQSHQWAWESQITTTDLMIK